MAFSPALIVSIIGGILIMTKSINTGYSIPNKATQYMGMFKAAELKYNLPENLLVRMAQQESYFNPMAYNPSGAQGMMQIIPRWHPTVKNPYNPEEAIPYAGKYLRQMYDRFKRWDYAIMGYNWGPNAVARWAAKGADKNLVPRETSKYLANISKDVRIS